MLRTTRNNKLIGIGGGELHGVADLIAPKTARGRDDHCIVLTRLHTPEWHRISPVHRDKLIEHPVVEHQQHRFIGRIILNTEETLTGIIGFHIMHVGRGDELLILFAVRREGHTTVEEYLDIRPHFLQMRLTRQFHHTGQYGEHP